MERILMQVSVISIGVFGLLAVFCAAVWFLTKARRWSVLALPRVRLVVLAGGAIVATFAAQKGDVPDQPDDPPPPPSSQLVCWSTFDSADAVTTPAVGVGGSCNDATFVKGRNGAALYVPANSNPSVARLSLPDGLPAARGCIELWARIDASSDATYSGGGGTPDFFTASTAVGSSTFISLAFTNNDGAGRGGLVCGYGFHGFEMGSESFSYAKPYSAYLTGEGVSDWHHYALVWNVDGISSLPGTPRAALLLDGTMQASTQGSVEWNRDKFLEAMAEPAYLNFGGPNSHTAYFIDEIKVWSTDRTTFGTKAELVYWSTLDSAAAITQPLIGSAGTCTGATFKSGKNGSALHVPARSNVASLPLPDGLPISRGCVEFWARLEGVDQQFGGINGGGFPIFWRINTAEGDTQFFAFEFLANDGGGRGGLCAGAGALGIRPETWSYWKSYSTYIHGDLSDWHHYAYVWNVNGIEGLSETPNAAILVDGEVVAQKTADNGWNKDEYKAIMAQASVLYFGSPTHSNTAFSIDELKIWNADKTTFEDDVPAFVYYQNVAAVYDGQAHALLPPEGLSGNETFRYALDQNGPFADEMPSLTDAGTLRIWYEETVDGMTIVSSAKITVERCPLTFTSASATKAYDGTPLTASTVAATGLLPMGEGFSFAVTGSQTIVGESQNVFTWTANEGTKAGNYNVTAVFGTLKVVLDEETGDIGYELVADGAGGQTIRITRLSYPDGGDVTLPVALGGISVGEVAPGALAGTRVTGVRVPAGVTVAGTLFENLPQLTNATLEAGSAVSGALSFSGSAALREVIVSADVTTLAPHAFLGCWDLARVVFAGEPPFGNAVAGATGEAALLAASVRPATLLQMADMICYPVDCATRWEKALRNFGYGGRYGAYVAPWTGEASLVADSGNLNPAPIAPVAVTNTLVVTNMVIVTNMMYSVVTNVLVPAVPDAQPGANYGAQAGVASGMILAGAAGWDMFGVPDGMTWDRATGTLGGVPARSGIYDVMLVSGSGAQTKLMRTTINVAGYAATTGYVGVAFSASGLPWDDLSSYKNPPAGLKWTGKVLSGVPTKAGAYSYETTAGEPIELTILALPDGAVGSYNGEMADGDGVRYPLTVSATAAGKITAKVIKGTKTLSLSATKWESMSLEDVNGAPHRIFYATLTANGLSLSVRVDADAAWNADALTAEGTLGALANHSGSAQRNAYASDDAAKAAIAALAKSYALMVESDGSAGWVLVPAEPGVKGSCDVVLKATGVATLSGKLPNKTSVNTTATLRIDERGAASLRFYAKGAWIVWENLE